MIRTITYDDTLYQLVPKDRKLIGWRTENFLYETSDPDMAKNWEPNIGVLPIFGGDPNTMLSAAPTPPAQPAERMPLPDSYRGSTLVSDPGGSTTVKFYFDDTKEAEDWFEAIHGITAPKEPS